MRSVALLLAVVALMASACGGGGKPARPLPAPSGTLRLTSPAIAEGGTMPRRYTCDGPNVSPPLSWSGVPQRARELALVVEDPDAGGFVHWTVLGIAPAQDHVAEGSVPAGSVQTGNGFGKRGWGGPCPPKGDRPHRYVFAVYAADAPLGLGQRSSASDVRGALARHAVARGTLTARYGRT